MNKVIRWSVRARIYFMRTSNYAGMARSIAVFYLVLADLQSRGLDIDLGKWVPLVLVGCVVVFMFFGWLEVRCGALQAEQDYYAVRNTRLEAIYQGVQRIEKEIGGAG